LLQFALIAVGAVNEQELPCETVPLIPAEPVIDTFAFAATDTVDVVDESPSEKIPYTLNSELVPDWI
jgi:hypothetical protein